MFSPVALNANTTYGIDTSAANNYGLGVAYESPRVLDQRRRANAAAPSWWWLVGFLIVMAVLP